jgi:aryl-alcohol dehydrogenase-like predicted oxidoreductase
MRFKKLGKTNLDVSVVGLGTWPMSNVFWGAVDDAVSISAIQKAIDCGINLIDTAPSYGSGHAETIVGQALKGRRDKAVIATKCGVYKNFGGNFGRDARPLSIRQEMEDSLKRLDVDCIDIYQIHWPDPQAKLEPTFEELARLKAAGKFKYLGVSNFGIELMEESAKYARIDCIQPRYSMLSRENEALIQYCHAHQIGVLSYGSLDGGLLTGKFTEKPVFAKDDTRKNFYHFFEEPMFGKFLELQKTLKAIADSHGRPVAHVAINWVSQQAAMTTALVGAKTPQQAEENALSAGWELTAQEIERINAAYTRIFA